MLTLRRTNFHNPILYPIYDFRIRNVLTILCLSQSSFQIFIYFCLQNIMTSLHFHPQNRILHFTFLFAKYMYAWNFCSQILFTWIIFLFHKLIYTRVLYLYLFILDAYKQRIVNFIIDNSLNKEEEFLFSLPLSFTERGKMEDMKVERKKLSQIRSICRIVKGGNDSHRTRDSANGYYRLGLMPC